MDRVDDREPEGFFRSLRSASARDRKQYVARARLLHDFTRVVEEHLLLPDVQFERRRVEPDSDWEVERAAEAIRDAWGIGQGPIDNVIRQLEVHGVLVVRSSHFTREVDAFSVCFADRPIVVLGANKDVTARSRFDAAHQLGHLVMHGDEDAGTKVAEAQAHRFAAAFLMPSADIRGELPDRVDLRRLRELKIKWRVSMQALLMRAKTLDVMTPQHYTSAMKMFSARGWRSREPGDDLLGSVESPTMMGAALDRLAVMGLSVANLCTEGSLPVEEVDALIDRTRDRCPRLDF